ncbi:MAG: hypothetical protein ABSE39_11840 [Candidatus Bathyarchaeia archaeon]
MTHTNMPDLIRLFPRALQKQKADPIDPLMWPQQTDCTPWLGWTYLQALEDTDSQPFGGV